MKINLYILTFAMALLVAPAAFAQTVQVPGTYTTIQAAIDSFSADVTPQDNVVEITTVGPYTEGLTLTYPVTIRGAVSGGARPIIQVQNTGAGNDGIVVANGSAYNTLENLIVIPDTTTPPTDDGISITGAGTVCNIINVLACPSIAGSPASTDNGKTLPDLTGATFFGDEVVYVGSSAIIHATDMILTANVAPGTGHDLILISSTSSPGHTINKGCVFSFASRYIAQISNTCTIRGTTAEPVIMNTSRLNDENVANGCALGFFGNSNGTIILENLIVANANTDGIWVYTAVGGSPDSLISVDHVAVIGSGEQGLSIWTGAQDLAISNSTLINNYDVFENLVPAVNVTAVDCIFAGNGSTTANRINISAATPATMTLTNCAVVTSGPYSVASATDVIMIDTINDNPWFNNVLGYFSSTFLDVRNPAYDGKASGGGPLTGYGNYAAGQVTGLEKDWTLFR